MIARQSGWPRPRPDSIDLTRGRRLLSAVSQRSRGSSGYMFKRRHMFKRQGVGLSIVLALIVSVSVFAQKKDDKKQSDEQKKEVQALVKMVDDAAAGQAA